MPWFGGQRWIRTTEVEDVRFTVWSIWPLWNLPIYLILLWSRWLDSNPQPADYKSAALPIELHRRGVFGFFIQKVVLIGRHFLWCLEVESNHRQTDFQSVALPTELSRRLWRPRTGSNRRPPAWQAGALTNWAIGPSPCTLKQVPVYNNRFHHFCQAFFCDFSIFF